MRQRFHLLKTNSLPSDIDIHSDLLSIVPSALSRKRALKVGREDQDEMEDKKGLEKCILCDPSKNKSPGSSRAETVIGTKVYDFINDFPYLPGDQRVLFLWHPDKTIRENCIHKFKLADLRKMELYYLLKGCIQRGNEYQKPPSSPNDPKDLIRKAPDLMRMVTGFNLGKLAGQSIPHFHVQYGWEVVLNPRSVSQRELDLYFEELQAADLIIYEDEKVKIVAPWTPMGQFALDIYFVGKYDIHDMDDEDLKVFATVGHSIIQKYLKFEIQNLNIVFTNSPVTKEIVPLCVHFVPRVNMTALYEIKGVNVVDTPPSKIAEEFRRYSGSGSEEINWSEMLKNAKNYKPEAEYTEETSEAKSAKYAKEAKAYRKAKLARVAKEAKEAMEAMEAMEASEAKEAKNTKDTVPTQKGKKTEKSGK